MTTVASWDHIEPGRAPGTIFVRITVKDQIVDEHPITEEILAGGVGFIDGVVAQALAIVAGEARVFIYDGDTGECLKTIILYE